MSKDPQEQSPQIGAAEREKLRERLDCVEADPGGIDERYGREARARERIGEVRRELEASERHLEEASSESSRRDVWAAVADEARSLKSRRRR